MESAKKILDSTKGNGNANQPFHNLSLIESFDLTEKDTSTVRCTSIGRDWHIGDTGTQL